MILWDSYPQYFSHLVQRFYPVTFWICYPNTLDHSTPQLERVHMHVVKFGMSHMRQLFHGFACSLLRHSNPCVCTLTGYRPFFNFPGVSLHPTDRSITRRAYLQTYPSTLLYLLLPAHIQLVEAISTRSMKAFGTVVSRFQKFPYNYFFPRHIPLIFWHINMNFYACRPTW